MDHITKDQIAELLHYYQSNRQVGHTTSAIEGAKNSDCFYIVLNSESGKQIKNTYKNIKPISIYELYKLQGTKKPIVFDNAVLHLFFFETLKDTLFK